MPLPSYARPPARYQVKSDHQGAFITRFRVVDTEAWPGHPGYVQATYDVADPESERSVGAARRLADSHANRLNAPLLWG